MTSELAGTSQDPLPGEFFTVLGADQLAQNAALLSGCPVRKIKYPPQGDAYVIADYETASAAFSDPRMSKDPAHAPDWFRAAVAESAPILVHHMLNADPPRHTRLRKLVGRAFLPRQLEPRRARIQEIADDLIDAFPESGEIDLMDFALSLPMRMICELLGVPIEVRPRLHTWGSIISGAPYLDEESNKRLRLAIEGIDGFLRDLLKARREVPGDDLISQMLEVAHEGQEYTDDEVVATLVLLLIAGHRTTASLIGNGMRALFLHPDQLAMLSADPGLAPSAVEELLRYGSPLYRSTLRIATEDIELHGVTIGKGSFVHLMIDSANHDPAAFADPDRLDITRESTHHLSFGQGPHFCAGAPLSRIEGQVAFGTLFRRLQGLRLAVPAGQLTWIAGHSPTRTLEKLPVRYDRRLPR